LLLCDSISEIDHVEKKLVLCLSASLLYGTACSPASSPSSSIASDDIPGIIEQYRQEIPQRMQQDLINYFMRKYTKREIS